MEEDPMDLFDALVAKQASKDLHKLKAGPLSGASKALLGKLIDEIKQRGQDLTDLDLIKYQELGIPVEAVLFAGFVFGVAMPGLDLAEASTEPIGGLGVCLNVDAQPFAFYDRADGIVYLPGDDKVQEAAKKGTRFIVITGCCLKELMEGWKAGCSGSREGDTISIVVDGEWAGEPAENMLALFVRRVFAGRRMVFNNTKKMETFLFEVEMRKSMGL